jgi:hypothetical protein
MEFYHTKICKLNHVEFLVELHQLTTNIINLHTRSAIDKLQNQWSSGNYSWTSGKKVSVIIIKKVYSSFLKTPITTYKQKNNLGDRCSLHNFIWIYKLDKWSCLIPNI